MDQTILGIVGLGVFVLIAWLFLKLRGAVASAATRAVFRSQHEQGQALVKNVVRFRSPRAIDQTVDAVIGCVKAYGNAPAVVPGLHLSSRTDDRLVFGYGNAFSTSFEVVVSLTATGADACTGVATTARWTESNGLVANRDELARVYGRINGAVATMAGAVG